jgi:small subunit ribosomal protein S2
MITLQELIDSGVHFGHRVSRWNPKMKPYIYGRRNLIHIINLRETVRGIIRASNFLKNLVAEGAGVLFVGTKRQARNIVISEARRCGMPFVSERWLGGTLTNYMTIRERLNRLQHIENIESDGRLELYSKKEISALMREKRRILRNLEGIRDMEKLPGALIVVDSRRENIAVKEARKLGIVTICILDTDCDPDMADIAIPGNDDAFRSIKVLLSRLTERPRLWKRRPRPAKRPHRRSGNFPGKLRKRIRRKPRKIKKKE